MVLMVVLVEMSVYSLKLWIRKMCDGKILNDVAKANNLKPYLKLTSSKTY